MSNTTAERPKRGSLVLKTGVKNTLADSTITGSKKGAQRHVIRHRETRTLCRIDTFKWVEKAIIEEGELVNCPLCAKALKDAAKAAKAEAPP